MALGWFDETTVPVGWFDETTQAVGWFDETLSLSLPSTVEKTDIDLEQEMESPKAVKGQTEWTPGLVMACAKIVENTVENTASTISNAEITPQSAPQSAGQKTFRGTLMTVKELLSALATPELQKLCVWANFGYVDSNKQSVRNALHFADPKQTIQVHLESVGLQGSKVAVKTVMYVGGP